MNEAIKPKFYMGHYLSKEDWMSKEVLSFFLNIIGHISNTSLFLTLANCLLPFILFQKHFIMAQKVGCNLLSPFFVVFNPWRIFNPIAKYVTYGIGHGWASPLQLSILIIITKAIWAGLRLE